MPYELLSRVMSAGPSEAARWAERLAEARTPMQIEEMFFACGRHLPDGAVEISGDQRRTLQENQLDWVMREATWSEIARMMCILRIDRMERRAPATLARWFSEGALEEQRAILRSLALTRRPREHVGLAKEAIMSSSRELLRALACDNGYASVYLDDDIFDEMVDAAVRAHLPLSQVVGLFERETATLARYAMFTPVQGHAQDVSGFQSLSFSAASSGPSSEPSPPSSRQR